MGIVSATLLKHLKMYKKPRKSRKELRARVKQQQLSRALYELPLELKILIFQFAIISNMEIWAKDHATKFRDTLVSVDPDLRDNTLLRRYYSSCSRMGGFNGSHPKIPEPVPICEKCPEVRHKVNIPWDWVRQRVTEERYDQLECRDWGAGNLCEYWHNPKCWCKDCYDIRDLNKVYQETMRHWFLKYHGIQTEWLTQLRDNSISKEKRDLKLGFINIRRNDCFQEAPREFWNYLKRNYTWSDYRWAYVPK